MRLLLTLLLALPVAAQAPLHDPDFDFRITPPDGMQRMTPDELSALMGQPAANFAVVPRAQSPDGVAVHEYVWEDASQRGRLMQLALRDLVEGEGEVLGELAQWATAVEENFGVTIAPDDRDVIRRQGVTIGYRVEAERVRPDGALVRQIWCYVPLLVDDTVRRDRVAQLSMQALVADWDDFLPGFEATIASMDFPLPRAAVQPPTAGAPGRGGVVGAQSARKQRPAESWGSLQVTGSLLLAVLLLGSLFLRSRERLA